MVAHFRCPLELILALPTELRSEGPSDSTIPSPSGWGRCPRDEIGID